jgi:hypothetical protein
MFFHSIALETKNNVLFVPKIFMIIFFYYYLIKWLKNSFLNNLTDTDLKEKTSFRVYMAKCINAFMLISCILILEK